MCGSGLVQAWFRRGPGAFGRGSGHKLQPSCPPRFVRWWLDNGSGVVQAWIRCGSDVDRNVDCKHNVFHASFQGGSIMVQAWFMCGSGVVQVRPRRIWACARTPAATIVSSACRSMVARLWFRCGSGVVQAWFRCGSDAVGNVECKSNVVHEFFKDGSIMLQVWFMRGSGVVQAWFRCGPGARGRGSEHQLQQSWLPRVVQL